MTDTAIIIVNWNGQEHLEVCLKSVFSQTYKSFKVIFADNGSQDDSVAFVKSNFPRVEIVESKKNYGFAEGNNIGIRLALKNPDIKYIVTLNNDTEVHPDWLLQLIEVAASNDKVGAVSSKMLFFNKRNIIDSAGDFLLPGSLKAVARGYQQEDKGQFNAQEECFSARAGAALYKRALLEQVCLNGDYFDKHFFAYIEDTDLSVRAKLLGWRIMYAPKAIVYHKVAATTGKMSYAFRRYYSGRNRLFTAVKNYPIGLWLLAVRRKSSVDKAYKLPFFDNFKIFLRILGSLLASLPRLLAQRWQIKGMAVINRREVYTWMDKFIWPG